MNVSTPQIKGGFILPGMKRKEAPSSVSEHRIPYLGWLPDGVRNHFVSMCGEFVGTFLFLFFAFSATQVANTVDPNATATTGADTSRLLYISLAFGFSLAVNAWVFFRISGGLFNPAV
jgi:aquaporin related protein